MSAVVTRHDTRLLRADVDDEVTALARLIEPITGSSAHVHAAALLARWQGLGYVLATAPEVLEQDVPPAVAALLSAVRTTMLQALKTPLKRRPVIRDLPTLQDYLRLALAFQRNEHVRMLLLDVRRHLLADELLSIGTVDETPVYPREVARRCLELGAASIILVHNHPSGSPEPSRGDKAMTSTLEGALRPLGIILDDHLIVGMQGVTSLRSLGYLKP